jgi:hypothetical protein
MRQTRNADELRTKSRGSQPREDKEEEEEDKAAATTRGQGRAQPAHARWREQGEVNECSAGSLEECSTLNTKLNAKRNALGEGGQGGASVGLEEGDEQFADDSGGIEEEVSEEVGSLSWRLQALEKELDLEDDDVAAHEAV